MKDKPRIKWLKKLKKNVKKRLPNNKEMIEKINKEIKDNKIPKDLVKMVKCFNKVAYLLQKHKIEYWSELMGEKNPSEIVKIFAFILRLEKTAKETK